MKKLARLNAFNVFHHITDQSGVSQLMHQGLDIVRVDKVFIFDFVFDILEDSRDFRSINQLLHFTIFRSAVYFFLTEGYFFVVIGYIFFITNQALTRR